MKSLFAILCSLAISTSTHAGALASNEAINVLHYYEGHVGVLIKQPTMIDPDKCGRTDWYILRNDHPLYKEMYAVVLAAHMANKPVHFYLEGCVQGIPSIRHAYINK
ncbi:MAG: hypothetical protein RL497_1172 [Pseudomonadota bacterium]